MGVTSFRKTRCLKEEATLAGIRRSHEHGGSDDVLVGAATLSDGEAETTAAPFDWARISLRLLPLTGMHILSSHS